MVKYKSLKLEQLSRSIENSTAIPMASLGQRLKDIREAIGMTQKQLAARLGVKQPIISRMEDSALSCELKTIIKVFSALDLSLAAVLTSEKTLVERIKTQAAKAVKKLMERTYSNMALEKQAPGREEYQKQFTRLVAELSAKPAPKLWEE